MATARVNARDDRWRFEYENPQAGAMAAIVRADRRLAWLILSKRRVYMEVPIDPDHRLMVSETMEGEVAREFVGDEDLNGYPCELFEVTAMVKGEPRQFYQWVTKERRFSIKTVSKQGGWSLEYRNLRFVAQSDRLFEPPYGFSSDTLLKPERGAGTAQ